LLSYGKCTKNIEDTYGLLLKEEKNEIFYDSLEEKLLEKELIKKPGSKTEEYEEVILNFNEKDEKELLESNNEVPLKNSKFYLNQKIELKYKPLHKSIRSFSLSPNLKYIEANKIREDNEDSYLTETKVYFEKKLNSVKFLKDPNQKSYKVLVFTSKEFFFVKDENNEIYYSLDKDKESIEIKNIDKILYGNYYGTECVLILTCYPEIISIIFESFTDKLVFFQYISDAYFFNTSLKLRIWVNY
jgi:hypothetical protein